MKNIGELPPEMVDGLRRTDLIIHLGDYDSEDLIDDLSRLGDFHGITGNHDGPAIRSLLPQQDIIEIEGKRLALVHGHGCVVPFGFKHGLLKRFRGERIDAILYGHTHVAKNHFLSGVLFFNPGSAVGRFPSWRGSYGLLTIAESIHGEIVHVRKPGNVSVPEYVLPAARELVLQKVPVRSIFIGN